MRRPQLCVTVLLIHFWLGLSKGHHTTSIKPPTADLVSICFQDGSKVTNITFKIEGNCSSINQYTANLSQYKDLETLFSNQSEVHVTTVNKNQSTNTPCLVWNITNTSWSSRDTICMGEELMTCACRLQNNELYLGEKVNAKALPLVAIIGCSVSIIGLCITILILYIYELKRSRKHTLVEINVCFSVLATTSAFTACINTIPDNSVSCFIATVVFHYTWLTCWFWMSVYGYLMHCALVKPMRSHISHFVRKASFYAYGIPLMVVSLNIASIAGVVGVNLSSNATQTEMLTEIADIYMEDRFCWIHKWSLYLAFVTPVGILLLFNWTIFVIILREITCKRERLTSTSQRKTMRQQLTTIGALFVTLGLTSTLIFVFVLTVADENSAITWLLCIMMSFEGFEMFVFICIRQKDLRRKWLQSIRRLFCVKNRREFNSSSAYYSKRSSASDQMFTLRICTVTQRDSSGATQRYAARRMSTTQQVLPIKKTEIHHANLVYTDRL
uniref:adhesion G-protein coupled receptor G7-like n=1 Tax=Ciona intestinalis TaxID=7719 RepID=UPI00089DC512|nr:adhesion G-protein coupled receptor G7-like [Ciona intestinalis]|eukprot:XP_018668225.1 adhesion G-protein coupled receptor G7-like [Ciona intestinalis]